MLLRLGAGLSLAFVLLRGINVYGDPVPWTLAATALFTVLSFLNATKYPPSLLYLLMTLGPALLICGWPTVARRGSSGRRWSSDGCRCSTFSCTCPLIHLLALIVCYFRYGDVHWMFESARLDQFPMARPPGWGYSLPVVYVAWVSVVLALYPLCQWFGGLKQRRSDSWLSYL